MGSQGAGHGTGSTCCFPNPSPCREKHWFLRLERSPRAAASLAGGRLGAPTQHSPCTKIPPENYRRLLGRCGHEEVEGKEERLRNPLLPGHMDTWATCFSFSPTTERLQWIRAPIGAEREISRRPHASPAVEII